MISATLLHAADIIITRSSTKINAIIEEVGTTSIKYRTTDNPKGPLVVLETNQIATIIYGNGEVQTFEEEPVVEQAATPAPQPMSPYPQNGYGYNPNMPYPGTPGYAGDGLVRNGRNYYFNGQPIVLQDFLYQTCPQAYDYWRKNLIMECVGWGLLGSGIAITAVGSALAGIAHSQFSGLITDEERSAWEQGIAVAAVGAAFVATGIPLVTVGHIRRCKKAPEIFNQQCAKDYSDIRVDLQASQNGIGLALNF
ncbi:MAG: hypothetical protein KBS70_03290 [Bacteroidales bacterium]|nr:hypothetical protein [Candidatus Colicola equi]